MAVYRKDNRWYIDYYLPDGKRKREKVSIPGLDPARITRQEALKALSIRKGQIAEGKFNIALTDKEISFGKLMSEYLTWANTNHKASERDIAGSKPLLAFFKGRRASSINLWLVEKYKAERKAQGRKEETINKELGILRRMCNLALQWKRISSNPIQGMRLLKVSKFEPRVLKDWEFEKIYQSASPHFKPILLCAYMTGMRRGEIAKLKWENVDLEDGFIRVIETKNNESRSIPIAKSLLNTLKRLKSKAKIEFVFTTHEGKPYTHITVWKRTWETAVRPSGIGSVRFHDLRHTFVSNLIVGEKEDFRTVMELSGHKDTSMLKRYSHTQKDAKKAAIEKLEIRLDLSGMDTYLDTETTKKRTQVALTS